MERHFEPQTDRPPLLPLEEKNLRRRELRGSAGDTWDPREGERPAPVVERRQRKFSAIELSDWALKEFVALPGAAQDFIRELGRATDPRTEDHALMVELRKRLSHAAQEAITDARVSDADVAARFRERTRKIVAEFIGAHQDRYFKN